MAYMGVSVSLVGIIQLKSRSYHMLTVFPFKEERISSGEHTGRTVSSGLILMERMLTGIRVR